MRTDWDELSPGVRGAVEYRTGPVQAAYTVSAGKNSALAAILATAQRGSVFVKGLRTEDPRVISQDREAVVSPYVRSLSRELLWQTEADGWNLLGFQAAPGRHADYLLHTDYSPDNVLVDGSGARLIDWAWPTRGAGFIDPACLVVRLVYAGHPPEAAEAAVAALPAWQNAPEQGVDLFAAVLARMWTDIAEADPAPWKRRMSKAARAWTRHRSRT